MFWIVDSILMRKKTQKVPSVHYHKAGVKYDKLEPEDSCSECEVTLHPPTPHRTLQLR